ncbi:hypothetical protein K501DRAFT_248889 [Backusella circina FSU 941]|nr:hypothetical protein K501DRAFT_248889 [Backusella circina FSU 941]
MSDSNLKVVDAEMPQTTPSGQSANPLLHSTLDGLSNLSQRLNPITQKLSNSILQARQYAQERLGTAESLTELPLEYKQLEKRIDTLDHVYSQFLKVTKVFNNSSYDYPMQIQDSILNITRDLQQQLTSSPEKQISQEQPEQQQAPRTLYHTISKVAIHSADQMAQDIPLSNALRQYGVVTEQLADSRVSMDEHIKKNFHQPIEQIQRDIQRAKQARRQVNNLRLSLDAAKTSLQHAKPDRVDILRLKLEHIEDEFIGAVEQSTTVMKSLADNPYLLHALKSMTQAQLQHYKEAYVLLSDLAPEFDELVITQESLIHQ